MRLNRKLSLKIDSTLAAFGARVKIADDFITIDLSGVPVDRLSDVKDAIYGILNNCENDYFVLLKGLPPCFMPDAWDHFCQENSNAGLNIRLSICSCCRCRAVCRGIKKNLLPYRLQLVPVTDMPDDIVFELNKKCNLSCRFCSQTREDAATPLAFDNICRIINEASALGIKNIRFTGGEPLLRTDLPKILKFAKSKNLTVFLNTNATLLTSRLLKQIEPYVDNILVSLVGFNTYSEDTLGAGGRFFRKKIDNIVRIRRSNIPNLRLGTVISKMLLKHFKSYSTLVRALGPDAWEFYRPMFNHERKKESEDYDMTLRDYRRLLSLLASFGSSATRLYIANAFPFCVIKKARHRTLLRGARFDDGHSRLVMDSGGFFKPSYFISKNLGPDVSKAWKHAFIRQLGGLLYLPALCRDCRYINWCYGGSRHMAKVKSGNYFAQDPLIKTDHA